jgi:hypothetical protein
LGIKTSWQDQVWAALQDLGLVPKAIAHDKYTLLSCNDILVIHLIPLDNRYHPAELIALQAAYQLDGIQLVQLWEDIWYTRKEQVLGRLKSILGLNIRLHGRKGILSLINQQEADEFLNQNHLQGSAKARYKFALHIDGQLLAVACFSKVRLMKGISADYRSFELIRFATLMGFTVTGGFTKLLKHFIKTWTPNDIMSYADRDWSLGNAYVQSGFKLVEVRPPAEICLQKKGMIRFFPHRLPADVGDCVPVFNTGNLKYIWYL